MNMQLTLKPLPSPNCDMISLGDVNGLISAITHIDIFFDKDSTCVVYDHLRLGREVTVSLTVEGVR